MILPSDPPFDPPKLSKEILDQICADLKVHASKIYVIYNKEVNSVLFDKMTSKPVHNLNAKVLEFVAHQAHGQVLPLNEALRRYLLNLNKK